jgi:1-acyl-sn-glycerol-3-phosphate acyltransferase
MALDALVSSSVVQRFAGRAASAAVTAMPAVLAAAKALPPAMSAARSAVSAVVSGDAARDLLDAAADAGDAARRAINKVEPSTFDMDLFGEDPSLLSRSEPVLDFFYDRYFRVKTLGAETLPKGPCLLVCNHSGALPLDGLMVRTALRREAGRNDARWLVEDAIFHAPFLGVFLNRLGAVRACPENAERLLSEKVPLAVFPEGLLGISKRITERYRLQRFGRGGFVKLALRTGVPIVPVAVVGAEEATPLLAKIPVKSLGIPYLPVTPTFPVLGPLGLLPLPTKWTISILPPRDLSAQGPAGADDHALVAAVTAQVRDAVQKELDRLVAGRSSLFASA